MILPVVAFLLSASSDIITMWWHRARESGSITRTVALSIVLESLSWLPVVAIVFADDWRIVVASVLGAGTGTAIGMHVAVPASQQSHSTEHPHVPTPSETPASGEAQTLQLLGVLPDRYRDR